MLVVRGLVGLFFAAYLFLSAHLSWEGYFEIVARYLVIDGLVSALIAGMLIRESLGKQRGREMTLGVVTLVDAGGRIVAGAALMLWPGIAGFPVTAVMYVVIMAASTAALGLVEAWLAAREEIAQHGASHQAPQFMAGAVGLASLISTAFGVASLYYIGTGDTVRVLISCFVAAAAVVTFAMAWSRHRMLLRRAAALTPSA